MARICCGIFYLLILYFYDILYFVAEVLILHNQYLKNCKTLTTLLMKPNLINSSNFRKIIEGCYYRVKRSNPIRASFNHNTRRIILYVPINSCHLFIFLEKQTFWHFSTKEREFLLKYSFQHFLRIFYVHDIILPGILKN